MESQYEGQLTMILKPRKWSMNELERQAKREQSKNGKRRWNQRRDSSKSRRPCPEVSGNGEGFTGNTLDQAA